MRTHNRLSIFGAALLLLTGCASTKVLSVRPSPKDPGQEIVVTRSCRATGPMQHNGVHSFQLTRGAADINQWAMLVLGLPLDLVFLPIQAFKDLCCHTCTNTEETRPADKAL
ncbi:MAG: hypothetical protein HY928_01290 [Elusimicrobia bacterium]|nr:hypothetical protein [Elusimicrobiota bacterium]